MNRSPGDK
jgi:hypothetical protein